MMKESILNANVQDLFYCLFVTEPSKNKDKNIFHVVKTMQCSVTKNGNIFMSLCHSDEVQKLTN